MAVADKSILIDTGPDLRQQVLRMGLKHLDAVLFTHEHKDHTAGMDEVRAFNFRQGEEIPIYARASVLEQLRREFAYVFAEFKYPGIPRVTPHEITGEPFSIEGVPIIPIEVWHHKLPVYGFRIGDFAYLTDLNAIHDDELAKVTGVRVLVLDALRREPHLSHFTLQQALDLVERVRPERTYLTHLSHQMGLHREVEAELPPHVRLGYDGLQIRI